MKLQFSQRPHGGARDLQRFFSSAELLTLLTATSSSPPPLIPIIRANTFRKLNEFIPESRMTPEEEEMLHFNCSSSLTHLKTRLGHHYRTQADIPADGRLSVSQHALQSDVCIEDSLSGFLSPSGQIKISF